MPELPEVETVRRGLEARVIGRCVTAVEIANPLVIVGSPREFATAITGRRIKRVLRKGKALAIALEDDAGRDEVGRYLLLRLGMTGQCVVVPRGLPLAPHTHVHLVLDAGALEIRYRDVRRFGRLRACTRQELEAVFARLGPDSREITEGEFFQAMQGRCGAIKSWLMNQQLLSGLGNIYADEALFEAQIHPLAQPGRLSPAAGRSLHRAVKKVLDRAVKLGGTSFSDYLDAEGRPGRFRKRLCVYQRTGQPCPRCGQPIRRMVIAGRSTHFCPQCQPRLRRVAVRRGPRRPKPRTARKPRGRVQKSTAKV